LKTKEELLSQMYLTADELKQLMPTLGINKCRLYIKDIQEEMREKGYFVPQTTPRLALTKLIKKKFGF